MPLAHNISGPRTDRKVKSFAVAHGHHVVARNEISHRYLIWFSFYKSCHGGLFLGIKNEAKNPAAALINFFSKFQTEQSLQFGFTFSEPFSNFKNLFY